jgi:hypothetical protein
MATEQIEGKVEHVSEKAILLIPTMGPKQIWVPKSQIEGDWKEALDNKDADGNVTLTVSEWWYYNAFEKAWERE